ncbi:MAG: hypothetical protein A2845_03995 [Candidatus Lloydbacteria bacterium RIFCSPHIGHO2_01_FULL_49_22]|uniref:RNA polymerase sigma factor 70 region 4 type 2 domain-containing protein n=1 Tax=Candidatus Lloydbacteria bacterium RIFCSPHIGHO2_01_FULL_49_22 TaxID=1798658 RepID=A0A1G2CX41_9BACT|nr:MAG: hypothetical protein A2845_03995 [Candidatus Lloydbacteria bacterium RIFCSPHIGHO2_01_FULL_49_22]OGZ09088.1 MAG: hypothetical protein A3C14_03830 [Candidatus Lloydbacteria bacterium RIFCSPHIGHO2_02_FULL_50_18]
MNENTDITKRLDAIALLLLKLLPKETLGPDQDKILFFSSLGYSNTEIAKLLLKTPNQVKSLLHLGKKKNQ